MQIVTVPTVETYIEIIPATKRPRQPQLIGWLDLPRIYGQAGYDAGRLSGSDKATLYYLYQDCGIRFSPLDNGNYRVTLTRPNGESDD